ncbi:hypothetical protein L1856_34585 [Streptomyces sp. Tue 6430]|nr:hypothetical protein [Streptomyces sp. Tue 6430]
MTWSAWPAPSVLMVRGGLDSSSPGTVSGKFANIASSSGMLRSREARGCRPISWASMPIT